MHHMLQGKKIIIGVTSSIAAYKAAYLIRLFRKKGAEVKVIMTPNAVEFITPLTLATLSNHPVTIEFSDKNSGEWNNHVELGLWADLFLIAPTSANTLAKLAKGISDNLLTATYLSARCPVFIAPAMDLDMYKHASTQENILIVKKNGNFVIDPEEGELASGLVGTGRMAEPENIIEIITAFFQKGNQFKSKRILITAGPTYEPIDPVRFIGNHSSGKMGYALADAFASRGAEVVLISGPSTEEIKQRVEMIHVMTADQMYQAVMEKYKEIDIFVLAAAVADYKPQQVSQKKIKKKDQEFDLKLVKTVDIAQELGKIKKKEQFVMGFALETDNEIENAKQKIQNKNLNSIALNSLQDEQAGFKYDTNKITIIDREGNEQKLELKTKKEIAEDILDFIYKKIMPKEK